MFVKYIEVDEEHTIPIYFLFFFIFLPIYFIYIYFRQKFYFNFYSRRAGPAKNYEKYSYLLNFMLRIDVFRQCIFENNFIIDRMNVCVSLTFDWLCISSSKNMKTSYRFGIFLSSMYLWADHILWVKHVWVPFYYLKSGFFYYITRFSFIFSEHYINFNFNIYFYILFLYFIFWYRWIVSRFPIKFRMLRFDGKFVQHFQVLRDVIFQCNNLCELFIFDEENEVNFLLAWLFIFWGIVFIVLFFF